MHPESLADHRFPSGQKVRRVVTALESRFRLPSYRWLQYVNHRLAPTCRSRRGSYVPVGNMRNARGPKGRLSFVATREQGCWTVQHPSRRGRSYGCWTVQHHQSTRSIIRVLDGATLRQAVASQGVLDRATPRSGGRFTKEFWTVKQPRRLLLSYPRRFSLPNCSTIRRRSVRR